MSSDDLFKNWPIPVWHPGFGDPAVELKHLRRLAVRVLQLVPDAQISLDIPEPGLMVMQICSGNCNRVEVYSVPEIAHVRKRRFAIFVAPGTENELEAYESSVSDAAHLIAARL